MSRKIIRVSPKVNGRIRFRVFNLKGFIALRKYKSRGWGIERQNTFVQLHLGKTSIAVERGVGRRTYNFVGEHNE